MRYMKNRILSNIWGIVIGFLIAGLLWGVMRIEFILLVPYYYLVAIFVDLGVYLLVGIMIGRNVRTFHETRSWLLLLLLAIFYISDRFLVSRLLLGLPYAFSTLPPWRLPSEILVISTGILSSVISWKKVRPG
jgi:hypothetical protein